MITKPTKCGFLSTCTAPNGTVCAAFSTDAAVAMRDCYIMILGEK